MPYNDKVCSRLICYFRSSFNMLLLLGTFQVLGSSCFAQNERTRDYDAPARQPLQGSADLEQSGTRMNIIQRRAPGREQFRGATQATPNNLDALRSGAQMNDLRLPSREGNVQADSVSLFGNVGASQRNVTMPARALQGSIDPDSSRQFQAEIQKLGRPSGLMIPGTPNYGKGVHIPETGGSINIPSLDGLRNSQRNVDFSLQRPRTYRNEEINELQAAARLIERERAAARVVPNVSLSLNGKVVPVESLSSFHAERLKGEEVARALSLRAGQEMKAVYGRVKFSPLANNQAPSSRDDLIRWDQWYARISKAVAPRLLDELASRRNPAGRSTVEVLVSANRSVTARLIYSDNRAFGLATLAAYEALNGSEILEFPSGSARSWVQFVVDHEHEQEGPIDEINSYSYKGDLERK